MRAYHVCMYILPSLLSLTWPGKFNLPQLHSSYSTLFCKSFHTSNFERRKNLLYCVVIAQFILPCYRWRGTQPQQWTRYIKPQRASPFIFGRSLYVMPLVSWLYLLPVWKKIHAMQWFCLLIDMMWRVHH